jgi:hypothetical protein
MLDGRSFLAAPVETASRQLPRLPVTVTDSVSVSVSVSVRCGQALQLRPGAPAGVLLQASARLSPWMTRDGMGWHGTAWDGMGRHGMAWDAAPCCDRRIDQ